MKSLFRNTSDWNLCFLYSFEVIIYYLWYCEHNFIYSFNHASLLLKFRVYFIWFSCRKIIELKKRINSELKFNAEIHIWKKLIEIISLLQKFNAHFFFNCDITDCRSRKVLFTMCIKRPGIFIVNFGLLYTSKFLFIFIVNLVREFLNRRNKLLVPF